MDAAVERIIAEEKPDASDTHPPVRERIARFEAAGRAAVDRTDANRPATDLLAGGSPWLDAAEGELLVQDRPLATWDEVITAGVRRGVESEADELGASMRAMKLGDGGLDTSCASSTTRRTAGPPAGWPVPVRTHERQQPPPCGTENKVLHRGGGHLTDVDGRRVGGRRGRDPDEQHAGDAERDQAPLHRDTGTLVNVPAFGMYTVMVDTSAGTALNTADRVTDWPGRTNVADRPTEHTHDPWALRAGRYRFLLTSSSR